MTDDAPKRPGVSFLVSLVAVAPFVGCGGATQAGTGGPDASVDGAYDGGLAEASRSDADLDGAYDGGDDASGSDAAGGANSGCFLTTFLQVPGGGGLAGHVGSLTLGPSAGSELNASLGGTGGTPVASLAFTKTSATSAILPPPQEATNIQVPCAPLEFAASVAQLASGSLTYNAGTVFLSVEGTVEPVDAGNGCSSPGDRPPSSSRAATTRGPGNSPTPARAREGWAASSGSTRAGTRK